MAYSLKVWKPDIPYRKLILTRVKRVFAVVIYLIATGHIWQRAK